MAKGFSETDALLGRLPDVARGRLGYLLAEIGMETSAAQRAALGAKTNGTGYLGQGIDAEVLLEELRMRSGLLSLQQGKRNSRYYGRFVEYGRRAQTVRVTRGTTASSKSASTRRRIRKGLTVRKAYSLRVSAMAPREFIHLPDFETRVGKRTAEFWSEVLPA